MSTAGPQITFEVQELDAEKGIQIVKVRGDIDKSTMDSLHEKMDAFISAFQGNILFLDLSQLGFINSEGIGYLSDIHNQLETAGKKIGILNPSERILDIFQLVGLNQIIPCCTSQEECIKILETK